MDVKKYSLDLLAYSHIMSSNIREDYSYIVYVISWKGKKKIYMNHIFL